MSIFQHTLLLVVFSFLSCPVASQIIGYTPKEVKSGHCTHPRQSTGLVLYDAADCRAAAKVLGLGSTTMYTASRDDIPPGCSWYYGGVLYFNTLSFSTQQCGEKKCLCKLICQPKKTQVCNQITDLF